MTRALRYRPPRWWEFWEPRPEGWRIGDPWPPSEPRPVWRWPFYFRCWSCARVHVDCTCDAYICPDHDKCLAHVADRRIEDTPEEFENARRALGTVACSRCNRVGEYIEPSGLCWRCERGA